MPVHCYPPPFTGYGRCLVNGNGQLELISSAAHAGFTFRGKECAVYRHPSPMRRGIIFYNMSGWCLSKRKCPGFSGNDPNPLLITPRQPRTHCLDLQKHRATSGPVFIDKITGDRSKPIKKAKGPLIEFIGQQHYLRRPGGHLCSLDVL